MNPEYAAYCQADRRFYDAPHRSAGPGGGAVDEENAYYAAVRGSAPEGWTRSRRGDWLAYHPDGLRLPPQGWKIHVSAALDNAASVLGRVLAHCLEHRLAFKCIPNAGLLALRNAKYADRAGSGKFITVYPPSEEAFPEVCTALMELLEGEHGPYILSDLRCGNGPVHTRYGAFAARFCSGPDGRPVPAVADPRGRLVPDDRGPAFRVPSWVTPPGFLMPHLEARAAVGLAGLPYTVEKALHFSNGGGVYLGRDNRTGEQVVLKEARPYAGLAADGADAVARLERERTALEQLAGLDCVPDVRDVFEVGDHHFLVLQYIPGTTLNTVFARRFPLARQHPSPELLAEHAAWAEELYGQVERAVAAVHDRGIVISDLHMSNVMVDEEAGRIVLLDFEAASPAAERRRQIVANPAFVAPPDRRGTDIDRYALACLRLALYLPLTTLFGIDRTKAAGLARDIARAFPVPEDALRPAVEEILRDVRDARDIRDARDTGEAGEAASRTAPAAASGTASASAPGRAPGTASGLGPGPASGTASGLGPGPASGTASGSASTSGRDSGEASASPAGLRDWPRARDALARAITASCTPERDDRCFPGDIAQFATATGGQSFAHGAAGVLHALHETGAPPCPPAEEWLLRHAKDPASGSPLGFYDGLTGIAWTLHRIGRTAEAADLLRIILDQPLEGLAPGLHNGYAGIGLALDDLARTASATDAPALSAAAARCTALAVRALVDGPPSPRTGLLHGASGIALLLIRRYATTGDTTLLDLAAGALRRDLERCRAGDDGALLVVEGKRLMPYVGSGSAGIAAVIDAYLAHRPDPDLEAAGRALLPAALSAFYVQPGLLRGSAGLLLHLAATPLCDPADRRRAIDRHTDLLGSHALPYGGGLAFPGEQLMRLSMDLATGTAGALLALGAASGRPTGLPFLPAAPAAHPAAAAAPHTGPSRGRGNTTVQ
ncbi:protein kinase/lanthionine synthetase C family protein [Streptomyces sp. CAI-121]|uniref:class III lanthionine synthetase LanKC n=1 Tax=unclassified Streptomyces TaxID=2593676 RepID=UPI0015875635|nr:MULTISPECIES: class III lanthionine synthetase LanKC [unclassified Streptomyces]NUV66330.1 protein kinase/lanthionine synthetase C family protein [Streptomyces sp. CAI-121]NUW11988.1 protein kinase/lanthionine synthetase C family protein [Streptomyces sp. CAI-68]